MQGIPDRWWRRHNNPWSWYTRIAFAYPLYMASGTMTGVSWPHDSRSGDELVLVPRSR